MKIKFKSIAKQIDEPQIIEFEADAEYELFNDEITNLEYHTYTFKEPARNGQQPAASRIEINDKQINIFTGAVALSMKKDQEHSNSYIRVDKSKFDLITFLHFVEIKDDQKVFRYKLYSANKDLLGEFEVGIYHI